MVTTFLISSNYDKSASLLDKRRLTKQCVEAYQLLSTLRDLHMISDKLMFEKCPPISLPDLSLQRDWVTRVTKAYKELPYYLCYLNGKLVKVEKDKKPVILDKTYFEGKDYHEDGKYIDVNLKPVDYRKYYDSEYRERKRVSLRIRRKDVILREREDHIVKLGYVNHPALRMWLTYEDSLTKYLNAHLRVYKTIYGKNMNIPIFPEIEDCEKPWWINRYIINSHKAALLRKETFRGEKPHYQNFISQNDKYQDKGYIWPSSLSIEQVENMIEKKFDETWFAKITKDI